MPFKKHLFDRNGSVDVELALVMAVTESQLTATSPTGDSYPVTILVALQSDLINYIDDLDPSSVTMTGKKNITILTL